MPTRATARRALTEHKTVSPNIPKSYLNTRSNSLKKNNSTKQASHAMSKAVMNIYQDQPEIKQQNLKKRSMTNPENIDPENVKIPVRNSSHRQAVKNLAVPTETRLKSPARAMLPKSPQKSFSSTATQTENFVVPKKLENTKSQELDDLLLNENPENVKFWKNKFDTLEKLNKSLNSSYNELEINFKKEVDMNQKQKEVKHLISENEKLIIQCDEKDQQIAELTSMLEETMGIETEEDKATNTTVIENTVELNLSLEESDKN